MFMKFAAFVDPAAIFGPNLAAIPKASVCLEHDGRIGYQDPLLGFLSGLREPGTRCFRRKNFGALLVFLHRADKILHLTGIISLEGIGSATTFRCWLFDGVTCTGEVEHLERAKTFAPPAKAVYDFCDVDKGRCA